MHCATINGMSVWALVNVHLTKLALYIDAIPFWIPFAAVAKKNTYRELKSYIANKLAANKNVPPTINVGPYRGSMTYGFALGEIMAVTNEPNMYERIKQE